MKHMFCFSNLFFLINYTCVNNTKLIRVKRRVFYEPSSRVSSCCSFKWEIHNFLRANLRSILKTVDHLALHNKHGTQQMGTVQFQPVHNSHPINSNPNQIPPDHFPPAQFPPESNPTRSNPTRIKSHPINSNPIKSNPIKSNPNQFQPD